MRILMVMAHPDDEVICGWPILQGGAHEVAVIILANNYKKYGPGAIEALEEVGRQNKIEIVPFRRLDTNFSRIPPRSPNRKDFTLPLVVKQFQTQIDEFIRTWRPECVFTHNPMGEYGHGDHRFTFNLVILRLMNRLMLTDICFANGSHLSSEYVPSVYANGLYSGTKFRQCHMDRMWYGSMKEIYKRHKAWSWSDGNEKQMPKRCKLYTYG